MPTKKRKVRRKRTQTRPITLAWINYRAKGALTIFNDKCYALLTREQEDKADKAVIALRQFIDSLDIQNSKVSDEDN